MAKLTTHVLPLILLLVCAQSGREAENEKELIPANVLLAPCHVAEAKKASQHTIINPQDGDILHHGPSNAELKSSTGLNLPSSGINLSYIDNEAGAHGTLKGTKSLNAVLGSPMSSIRSSNTLIGHGCSTETKILNEMSIGTAYLRRGKAGKPDFQNVFEPEEKRLQESRNAASGPAFLASGTDADSSIEEVDEAVSSTEKPPSKTIKDQKIHTSSSPGTRESTSMGSSAFTRDGEEAEQESVLSSKLHAPNLLLMESHPQKSTDSTHSDSTEAHEDDGHGDEGQNNSNTSHVQVQDANVGNNSEDCRFVSFEEWKKLKEKDRQVAADSTKMKNATESLKRSVESHKNTSLIVPHLEKKENETPLLALEDQGRVYKDKFNYASVDCAATIVKTNSDAKGASAILTEVKDSYLLNKCSTANKFVVIELCQDILVSSVVMANFELFSSMFREVRFSVSDRFPVTKGWHELGQFQALNIRDMQTFTIENPLIWARYLKIEIVSHYGNEFYCPISLVRVHGKTMMEEFKDAEQSGDSSTSDRVLVPAEELFNDTAVFDTHDDECKVVTPYLALTEFLKDLNSSENYCHVPLATLNGSHPVNTGSSVKPTQESIFQNIVKRLSLLETNATLSLLYVEEQSKLLSNAFFNLENRQVKKFENLLSQLNETMHAQVMYLEKAVGKIKTESRYLFQAQSAQSISSMNSVRQEVSSFTREVSFLRKVVIADTLIILSLLVYVLVTRETLTTEEVSEKQKLPIHVHPAMRPFPVRHNRGKARRRK